MAWRQARAERVILQVTDGPFDDFSANGNASAGYAAAALAPTYYAATSKLRPLRAEGTTTSVSDELDPYPFVSPSALRKRTEERYQ